MLNPNKRITIFSPELQDRNDITDLIKDYLKKNFQGFRKINTMTYSSLGEPCKDEQIGHWGTGEILIIFDRRLIPKYKRNFNLSKESRINYGILNASLCISMKLCDEKEIPYLRYEGEKIKGEQKLFFDKLDSIKDKIQSRLEKTLQPSSQTS